MRQTAGIHYAQRSVSGRYKDKGIFTVIFFVNISKSKSAFHKKNGRQSRSFFI